MPRGRSKIRHAATKTWSSQINILKKLKSLHNLSGACVVHTHNLHTHNLHAPDHLLGFPGGSVVKRPPAKQATCIQSLGREDPLEKEMTTHSSVLAWRIPWTGEPGGLQSIWGRRESDTAELLNSNRKSCSS